jgi:VanZ family protein
VQVAVVIVISEMAYLSILPDGNLLRAPMDKILHFVLFGAVTFWLNLWLGRSAKVKAVPLAVLIPFVVAVLEEGAQFFSPVRTADFADLFSDLSGMLFFWWMSEQALKLRIKEKPAPQSPSAT